MCWVVSHEFGPVCQCNLWIIMCWTRHLGVVSSKVKKYYSMIEKSPKCVPFTERFFSIVYFVWSVLLSEVLLYNKPSLHRGLFSLCLANQNLFQAMQGVLLAGTCTKHANSERKSINDSQNYLKHGHAGHLHQLIILISPAWGCCLWREPFSPCTHTVSPWRTVGEDQPLGKWYLL